MSDQVVGDLTFKQMKYGTHQIPWDLSILLHEGAAALKREDAATKISSGHFRKANGHREELICNFHKQISAKLALGSSQHTVVALLNELWGFVAWADRNAQALSVGHARAVFRNWTEHLLERVNLRKDLLEQGAYKTAMRVADLVARATDSTGSTTAATLLRLTRIRNASRRSNAIGAKADRVNLENTFVFGNFLADICSGLTPEVMRGPLPVTIPIREGRSLFIACATKAELDLAKIKEPNKRRRYETSRAPLSADRRLSEDLRRTRLLTLRVEAELLIFIAQTGMNLAQAYSLKREAYRLQTDGDDVIAYRVYKDRRRGEAIFRCFKAYRGHLERYLTWLQDTGISEESERLFPFFHYAKIPAEHTLPKFAGIRFATDQLGIQRFGARDLRKTRVNWLLRRGIQQDVVAAMSAHSKQTLLRHYEEPHHQRAAVEITRFHALGEPNIESPGPGICVGESNEPSPIEDIPIEAPAPDCISPDGCLFCNHHRDVLSPEYCWKLASHSRLKTLETVLYKPPREESVHPANRVVDRINSKLDEIGSGSEMRLLWVNEARDSIRAGKNHPHWDLTIRLLEELA